MKNGAQPSDTVTRLMKANPAAHGSRQLLPERVVELRRLARFVRQASGVSKEMNDSNGVKALVEDIAKALVDTPGECGGNEIAGEHATVFELRVAEGDLGKVIGKQGRTARSIRTLLGAVGTKLNRRFSLEILE